MRTVLRPLEWKQVQLGGKGVQCVGGSPYPTMATYRTKDPCAGATDGLSPSCVPRPCRTVRRRMGRTREGPQRHALYLGREHWPWGTARTLGHKDPARVGQQQQAELAATRAKVLHHWLGNLRGASRKDPAGPGAFSANGVQGVPRPLRYSCKNGGRFPPRPLSHAARSRGWHGKAMLLEFQSTIPRC